MKKNLLQLVLCAFALIFVASMVSAYTLPTKAPSAGNTDGPLIIGAINQTKSGGLSVGSFQVRKDAYFAQNVFFNGLLRGGTATSNIGAPVKFGGPSNRVDALFSGAVSISGTYQSNTLKTGGGKKPLCADSTGTLYICGTSAILPPPDPQAVILSLKFNPDGSGDATVSAKLSTSIEKDVTVHVSARKGSGSAGPISFLKNFYTANAFITPGVCPLSTTFTPVGSVLTISAGTLESNQLGLPPACNESNTDLIITSYSPTTSSKGPIEEYGT